MEGQNEDISITVTGDAPAVVDAISSVIYTALVNKGFGQVAANLLQSEESLLKENGVQSMLDICQLNHPNLLNANISITQVSSATNEEVAAEVVTE